MRNDSLFVPARHAEALYREIPEGRRIKRTLRPKGRLCLMADCETVLSTYNHLSTCWVHSPHYERGAA